MENEGRDNPFELHENNFIYVFGCPEWQPDKITFI